MKIYILPLILLLQGLNASAQLTNESEKERNRLLRENALKAQEQQDKLNADKPKSTLNSLKGSQGIVDDGKNLTDQDKQLSENFVHQGKANRIYQENCTGEMSSVCNGNAGKHKFMGMDPGMVKGIAQAYAMFGSMGGDGLLPLTKGKGKSDGKGAEAAKETPKKDETAATEKGGDKNKKEDQASDYCKYIPAATEGIATFSQQSIAKELQSEIGNGETAQKDTLLKAAKSHDNRAKMAQVQAAGWFGGAACYGVSAATGSFAVDKNLVIKIGAATLLGAFYQNEVAANKEYAEKVRKIADALPGKGDCNPITDKLCYCSQPETQNDPQYCLPQLHKKLLAKDSYRIACTDENLKIDPTCACEARNTCLDNRIELQSQGALNLGTGYVSSPFKSVRSLTRGELEGGTLNSRSYDRTAAIAKKALNELGSKFQLTAPLTKAQKNIADGYVSQGIPANVAAMMAQTTPSQAAMDSAMAKLSSAASGQVVAVAAPAKSSNIVDFSGGAGLGVRGEVAKKSGDDDLSSKLKLGGDKKAANSKLVQFAERAEAQAARSSQITRDNERPLFEIISSRYQLTGRKLLEVEGE